MPIIETRGLKKVFKSAVKGPGLKGAVAHLFAPKYRESAAVSGVDLSIAEGEAVAYVGPNGAGKSTTIKMLTGILKPSGGEVRVNGLDPFRDRMRNARGIGVVFGQRTQLWWDIAVEESFTLIRDVYDVPAARYRDNLAYLTEVLDLGPFLGLSARKLSLGQRMRADLAMSLLHDPRILFLDEPTIGLDVAVKERIREFLKELNKERGTTLLLTSHDLDDIEDVCPRLVIIDKGTICYDGALRALLDRAVKERTLVARLSAAAPAAESALASMRGVSVSAAEEGRELSVSFDRFAWTAKDIASALFRDAEVLDFQIEEPEIESVIKNLYRGTLDLGGQGTGAPAR